MLSQTIRHWIWSGIVDQDLEDQSPVRICNALSFCFFVVAILQLPILILFWPTAGSVFLPIYAATLVGAALVPVANHMGSLTIARQLLMFSYAIYILTGSIVWQTNIGIQHFMLLGIFVCPFVFYSWENKQSVGYMFAFALVYFSLVTGFTLRRPFTEIEGQFPLWLSFINSLFFTISALSCSYFIQKNLKKSWLKIHADQTRANQLLENTFPKPLITKLKSEGQLQNEHLPQVTVLFADIQGYSKLCQTYSAQDVVALLSDLFSRFDIITRQYKLEKIKTIGDEYMAVSGAPIYDNQHADLACQCALDMQKAFHTICVEYQLKTAIRVGLATGNVIAGVIGKDKYSYDIWGNAVNLAAQMQSLCEPGRIQVSQSTAELSEHKYAFSLREEVKVKGIGSINTFWLKGIKTHV